MDGLQDEARLEEQGTTQQAQGASAQVSGGEGAAAGGGATPIADGAAKARADYEAALAERDARARRFRALALEPCRAPDDCKGFR